MATEQQIEQTVATCMSIMARHHDAGRTARDPALLVAEVQLLAAWMDDLGIGRPGAYEQILRPVGSWLLDCYGPELGASLNAEFVAAFEGLGTIREAATADPILRVG